MICAPVSTVFQTTVYIPFVLTGKQILQWYYIILIYFLFLPVIDIQAFERLLGPCMNIMKRNISQYEDQLVALFGSSVDLNH